MSCLRKIARIRVERPVNGDRTGQEQEHRVIELGTAKTFPQYTDDIYAEDRGGTEPTAIHQERA
jgi:hypothetical protein